MSSDEEMLFSRLIIAVPELQFDEDYVSMGLRKGFITEKQAKQWRKGSKAVKKGKKLGKKLSSGTILERVMVIMPEIMSVTTVNFLRGVKIDGKPVLSTQQANAMRAAFRGGRMMKPVFAPNKTVLARIESVFGAVTSSSMVNLVRNMDDARIEQMRKWFLKDSKGVAYGRLTSEEAAVIRGMLEVSISRAQVARSGISSARIIQDTVKLAKAQKDAWGATTVVMDQMIGYKNGDRMLKNAIRAGVLSQESYDVIRNLEKYGFDVWRKVVHAKNYKAWAARTLLMTEGILSIQMIDTLVAAGYLPKPVAKRLYPVATKIREMTRNKFHAEHMKSARFRVVPGESPIKTFTRISKRTDGQVLQLLEEAARDTQKSIAARAGSKKVGSMTRAAQERALLVGIHTKMRETWEDVGSLIIFGEREAAQAGVAAADYMMGIYGRNHGNARLRGIQAAARAGVDAMISREENMYQLSRRVYKNAPLSYGLVEREIQKGLIRGFSAREMAGSVFSMISPSTPGGASFAAMRLARTEINNAFHFSQIRYTREMPWVEGYKWNLSGSHPENRGYDECEDMADEDHEGKGGGVYAKDDVPGKPHPLCLCYITTVMMSNSNFDKRLKSGAFDNYLDAAESEPVEGYTMASTVREAGADYLQDYGSEMGKALAMAEVFELGP